MRPGLKVRMIPKDPAQRVVREQGSWNQVVCDNKSTDRRFFFRGEGRQMAIAIDAPRPPIWAFLLDSVPAIECRLWNLYVAGQLAEVRMAKFDDRNVTFQDPLEIGSLRRRLSSRWGKPKHLARSTLPFPIQDCPFRIQCC
jgi:hypothetical protein